MSAVRIRFATADDAGLLLQLVQDLAAYERAPDAVVATEEDLRRHGFGPERQFEALLAFVDGKPSGFALFHPRFSTWLGRPGVYLEDLFVTQAARGPLTSVVQEDQASPSMVQPRGIRKKASPLRHLHDAVRADIAEAQRGSVRPAAAMPAAAVKCRTAAVGRPGTLWSPSGGSDIDPRSYLVQPIDDLFSVIAAA